MKMLLAAMWLLVGMAGAQGRRPMTFEDLMAFKRVSDPQISPSGKWVMFSVTDVSLKANTRVNHLWVVPLAGGQEHQVTFGDGETNGRFSPDAKYVSLEQKGQIYLAGWDEAQGKPGPARQLTDVSTEAGGAVWSPDAGRLLFVSSVYPECSDLGDWPAQNACNQRKDAEAASSQVKAQVFSALLYRHWNAYTGFKRSHVFAVSVNSGKDVRDLTPRAVVGDAETPSFSLGGPLGYAWAPDSHEIAYVTNPDAVKAASTNNDVFTLRLDEPGAQAVKVSTSPGSDDGPQYSPDGKWLAFRSQARAGFESDKFRLMLLDRSQKTLRQVAPSLDRWVDEFVWAPAGEAIYFASSDAGGTALFSISPKPESKLEWINNSSYDPHEQGELHVSADGRMLVSAETSFTAPTELAVTHLDQKLARPSAQPGAGAAQERVLRRSFAATQGFSTQRGSPRTQLTHLNTAILGGLALDEPVAFAFNGAEEVKVEGFVVKPPNFNPGKRYPVKFLIHGGPQGAWGDAWSYRWNPELMAASGYVVVMVNPRGSTGYGQAFIDGVSGDWGGKAYLDLMKGLDAAEAQFPYIDKSRECALGASYGGYMANWILTHTDRFKCIVTHDGMYNPVSAYGTTEELWFNEWEFRRPGDPLPGQPWRYAALPEDQDPFRKWSPALHIQDAKTPTLVIHGQKDYRLDVSEGFQLFTALQRLGVPSKMLYFPDEGHWVLKPQNSELWNKTISDWCDQWTHTNAYAAK